MAYIYEQIVREYKQMGPANFCRAFCEALTPDEHGRRQIDPWRLSYKALAEQICGPEWVRSLQPDLYRQTYMQPLRESTGDAVDVSIFSNITGQIVYSVIHQGWEQTGMIGDLLFTTRPTRFDGEKIPGIGMVDKTGYRINPGMPYPYVGLSEHYFNTPSIYKHGLAVAITKEAIFFDHTNLINQRALEIGKQLRYNKEDRQLAVAAGITIQLSEPNESFNGNNHSWNGTSYNTYSTTSNAIGINALASNELVDWTSVNNLLQLGYQLTHPDTGRTIDVNYDTLLVMPKYEMTARRIVTATNARSAYPSTGTSGAAAPGNIIFDSPNPLPTTYKILKSSRLRQLVVAAGEAAAKADKWWYLLDSTDGRFYMENWPFVVVQAPPNSPAEFDKDIVLQYKASERGEAWQADPRKSLKAYDTTDL